MIFGGKKLWSIANAASEVILKGLGGKKELLKINRTTLYKITEFI